MSNPRAEPPDDPPPPVERRRTPADARSRHLLAVKEAWRAARDACQLRDPRLARALAAYAPDGRARGGPVTTLLRALDILLNAPDGAHPALDFGRMREWAGTLVIRRYYVAE